MENNAPSEFRIFKKGWNQTEKGDLLFDDLAAKWVMDEYRKRGRKYSIDLEHLSIDQESSAYDPDSRGAFDLELRHGELWAVNVSWTPDGESRIKNKTQRFISPFVFASKKTKRVQSLYNVAICAVPATYDPPALVAASLRSGQKLGTLSIEVTKMEEMKKIATALGLGEEAQLEDCLSAIKTLTEDKGEGGEGDGSEVLKKLRAALKLKEDASEEECMSALKKLSGDEELEDKKDGEEKDKEKLALRGEVMALRLRLEKVEKTTAKSEREKLIEDNVDRIPLHLEAWAKDPETPIETLGAFLKASPPVQRKREPQRVIEDQKVELTKGDMAVALNAGVDPKVVEQYKKDEAEKKKQRALIQQAD